MFWVIVEFAYNNSRAPSSVEDMNYYTAKVVRMYSYTKPSLLYDVESKFQCDPFSNKKDVSQRSSCRQWGLSEMAYFIFGYFSTNFGTSVDGHENIIT
jgi:hypothetical protein